MKALLNIFVITFLLVAASSQCFALTVRTVVTKKVAKEIGIEVRARRAGSDDVGLALEFKPEGKLKEFTRVELKMTEREKSLVVLATLREKRSSSGSITVTFTAGRVHLEKTTVSVVTSEDGDHIYELRMKDFVDLEKVR